MRYLQNRLNSTPVHTCTLAVMALLACAPLNAAMLFSDNFQSGLSQWVPGPGGPNDAVIVPDPTYGHVLSFSGAGSAGEIQTTFTAPANSYLSFDYRGVGGFIGTYPPGGYPPTMGPLWLAGQSGYNQNNISANYQTLTYDGPTWSHYQVEVPMSGTITAEIWVDADCPYVANFANIVVSDSPIGSVGGPFLGPVGGPFVDANGNPVSITPSTPVPEPSTMIAGALALLPFGFTALRSLRKRQLA